MSVYEPTSPATPIEDVNRGTVVALAAIPVGVIIWTIVWTLGAILSVITYGVAFLAMFLYKLGSGGTISRAGAVRVTIVTIVTVALSIIAGLVSDVAMGIGRITNEGPIAALSNPQFGQVFSDYLTSGDTGLGFSIAIAVAFGLLGCFGVLRSAFKATAPEAPTQPWATVAPADQAPMFPPTGQVPPTGQAPMFPPADQFPPAPQAPTVEPTDPAAPRV